MTKKFPMIFNKTIHATLAAIFITMFSFNTNTLVCKSTSENQKLDYKNTFKNQELRREKILKRFSTFEKNIYTETLANGLKVVLYHYKNSPKVYIDMIYNVGSKDETPETYGLAHFLEHMIFKGTQELSEQDIPQITKKFGAEYNAETSHDTTNYWFITDTKNYPVFLDILADCMHNATFDEQHIASELHAVFNATFDEQHIASELHAVFSELKNKSHDNEYSILQKFLPVNHPYHHPIIGYKETLFTFNRDMLLQFYKTYYQPHNATLLITGNLDPKITMPIIRSIFESLPVTQQPSKKTLHFPSCKKNLSREKMTCYDPHETEANETLFWQVPGCNHDNFFIANIISKTLPNFIRINPNLFAYEGFASITFYPQQDFYDIKKQSEEIIKELENISAHGIDPKDLDSYKTQALSYVLHDFEGIGNIHNKLKKSITHNFNLEHNELAWLNELKKINTCTNENIKAFAKQYLQKNNTYCLCTYTLEKESDQIAYHAETDAYDQALLALHHRTAPLQEPKKALSLSPANLELLPLTKPQKITLSNGLTIFFIHNENTSLIEGNLYFKNENAFEHFLNENNQTIYFDNIKKIKKNKEEALDAEKEKSLFLKSYGARIINKFFKGFADDYKIIIKYFLETHITPINEQAILENHNKSIDESTIRNNIISYKKFFNPANMQLIITGDFSKPNIKEKICTLFEQWKNQKEYFDITTLKTKSSSIDNESNPTIDDEAQKTIKIFRPIDEVLITAERKGPSAKMSKDIMALIFLSMLVNNKFFEIREAQGLFYDCSFEFNPEQENLTIRTQTLKSNYKTIHQYIIDTLEDISNTPYPQDIFDYTRSSMINTYAVASQDMQESINLIECFIKKDIPLDYYHQQIESVLCLKAEDVTAAAKKYLDPSTWSFTIEGRIDE